MIRPWPSMKHSRGAALLTALFLLLAVLIVGVSGARVAVNAEHAARHERDRHIAFVAAEAALADAELDIAGGSDAASVRASFFADGSALAFAAGCGAAPGGPTRGLCARAAPDALPVWQQADLAGEDGVAVPYGAYTGAAMPTGSGALSARSPRYIIELLPLAAAPPAPDPGHFYRITAIGFGALAATRVVLQTVYRKPPPVAPPGGGGGPSAAAVPAAAAAAEGAGAGAPGGEGEPGRAPPATVTLPEKRISWREVANWQGAH
jgi:Tfp pilus assembly protein PilX